MNEFFKSKEYQKKGFDDRIVRYEKIHKIKEQDYQALIKAIDPQEGEAIFEGCAGYADVSKHIAEATKDFDKKPELYIQDESLVQMTRAQQELELPADHMVLGDIRMTEMAADKFDKVVIKMGIHELPEEEQSKVFSEMYRILKPSGKFIIWELALDNNTQTIFQDIVRKKDQLAGFDAMEKNRYFPKYTELQELFQNAGFKEIKDEYKIRYTFNPKGRHEELVSKDRLEILNEKGLISNEDEILLNNRAEERVSLLIQYIREQISDNAKNIVDFKDLGDDIEISVNKIIMSGKK